MKRFFVAALLALGVAMAALAQDDADDLGGYNALRIDHVGYYKGFLDGRIESFSDGVNIVLLSDDPNKEALPISANRMSFTWPEGETKPSRIVIEGKVAIDHPKGRVKAEKADWDFETGILTFTGNPVMDVGEGGELRGDKVILSFDENRLEILGLRADRLQLSGVDGGQGGKAAALELQESDVRNWDGFLAKMKEQAAATEASPGKQIIASLKPEVQELIKTLPASALLENRDKVLKEINRVLTNPGLYDEAAWQGITLDDETRALLGESDLSAPDQARLNRALIEAAYPDFIAKRPKTSE